jgi:hypothetical protein
MLESLLEYVKTHVPEANHAFTPVYVLGGSGARASADAWQATLSKIRVFLAMGEEQREDGSIGYIASKNHPFYFRTEYAALLPGETQATYAWVATAYGRWYRRIFFVVLCIDKQTNKQTHSLYNITTL